MNTLPRWPDAPMCLKFHFLPSVDCDLVTFKCISEVHFLCIPTQSPVKVLAHRSSLFLGPTPAWLSQLPWHSVHVAPHGVWWLCLCRTCEYKKFCFLVSPFMTTPDWPSPQRTEKKKKRTCVSEVGIEHSVMKLNKKLGNETAYMEILYIIRHHCQTVARDLK